MAKAPSKKSGGGNGTAKGGSGGIVALVLLTLIGSGLGVGYKLFVLDTPSEAPVVADAREKEAKEDGKSDSKVEAAQAGAGEEPEVPAGSTIVKLPPIVADMVGEPKRWVRIEASLLFSGEPEEGYDLIAQQTSADVLGFLRTVRLSQIEGPEGLEYLTDDLEDLARVRSKGAVTRLLISSLVTE